MFVTMPRFQSKMSDFASEGQKYWTVVTASFPVEPWYMFVYEGQVLDARVNLTILVAWEETLLDIIESVPAADRRSVYRVERSGQGGLAFRGVRAIWAPTMKEASDGVTALLELEGESELVDPQLRPVSRKCARHLVFREPKTATSQRRP